MQKNKIGDRIVLSALKLAAKNPWHKITLEEIAKNAKISLSKMKRLFPDKLYIIQEIVNFIDNEMERKVKTRKKDYRYIPSDEKLFEIIMTRLDVMQKYRDGITSIMKSIIKDPSIVISVTNAHLKSTERILKFSKAKKKQIESPLILITLIIYQLTLAFWLFGDISPDKAKTMSFLDFCLRTHRKIRIFLENKRAY